MFRITHIRSPNEINRAKTLAETSTKAVPGKARPGGAIVSIHRANGVLSRPSGAIVSRPLGTKRVLTKDAGSEQGELEFHGKRWMKMEIDEPTKKSNTGGGTQRSRKRGWKRC